jgi:hypothetical protein
LADDREPTYSPTIDGVVSDIMRLILAAEPAGNLIQTPSVSPPGPREPVLPQFGRLRISSLPGVVPGTADLVFAGAGRGHPGAATAGVLEEKKEYSATTGMGAPIRPLLLLTKS